MRTKIRSLEIRIAKLEREAANSWIEMKIEEFENSLNSVYNQNKKGLKKLKEILLKQGLNNPNAIRKEIEKVGKNASPLEKEVLSKIKSLPTLKARIDYLYSLWKEKYDNQFEIEKTSKVQMVQADDIFWVALSHGLFYALKLSMGSLWVITFGSYLTGLLLVGMISYLVLVDFGMYRKIKNFIIGNSKDIKKTSSLMSSSYPALIDLC